jgi:hypothetical protein
MMKKIVLTTIFLFILLSGFAQEKNDSILRSKRGIPILPVKGDWAIGADVVPYLTYLGIIFNNTSADSLDLSTQTIYARYFLSDNIAVRALFGIDRTTTFQREYVQDDAAVFVDPLSRVQTEDSKKSDLNYYALDLGIQVFRGYGRLKGFYGAHLGASMTFLNEFYSYGNPITGFNTTPSSIFSYTADGSRKLNEDGGINYALGGGVIAGIEYYFLPKACIGGEITLSVIYCWKTQGDSNYEHWNGSKVENYDIAQYPEGPTGASVYTLRPANFSPGLYLMFHF